MAVLWFIQYTLALEDSAICYKTTLTTRKHSAKNCHIQVVYHKVNE